MNIFTYNSLQGFDYREVPYSDIMVTQANNISKALTQEGFEYNNLYIFTIDPDSFDREKERFMTQAVAFHESIGESCYEANNHYRLFNLGNRMAVAAL